MTPLDADRWLRTRRPLARPRLRLICLPYSGGGATLFHAWPDVLPADVEVRAVQLPGRQDRLSEPPLTSVATLTERLHAALAALPPAPLAFYGHSVGALVAFELSRRLQSHGTPPVALIVAARGAPHVPRRLSPMYNLPEAAFLDTLHRRYGSPLSLLQNAQLMELCLPSLRADLMASDTYVYTPSEPLRLPVTVLHGRQDSALPAADVAAWRELAAGPVEVHEIDAGHLFVDTHRPWVLARVGQALRL
jgi:surfactin synthase thioesterase subunit